MLEGGGVERYGKNELPKQRLSAVEDSDLTLTSPAFLLFCPGGWTLLVFLHSEKPSRAGSRKPHFQAIFFLDVSRFKTCGEGKDGTAVCSKVIPSLNKYPSVFVDVKEMTPIELGTFRQQYDEQRSCVDEEVSYIILSVEAGQTVKYNRKDTEEFEGRGKLATVVHLFPMYQ